MLKRLIANNYCIYLEINGIAIDQWRSIDDSFAVRDEDLQQDFLKTFIPEPDYTVTPVALTFTESEALSAETEAERASILKNEPTIRKNSWWDWRVQNWGTKWDVYGVCRSGTKKEPSDCFSSNCLTAWSPLSEDPTLFQIACVDMGVIRWVNADLVTHVVPAT